jgi:alpha-ribazole phosphatase
MGLFYLVRHGETEWNAENRICGRSDVPLSQVGRRQAKMLAERLKSVSFDAIFSSPLERAIDTARFISERIGLEPVVDDRLVELDYGQWEGKTMQEIMTNDTKTFLAWQADPGEVAPPGGETGLEAQQRVVAFLDSLAAKHREGEVAVVFHKSVCRLAICHVLGMSPSDYRRKLIMENAALSVIQSRVDGWQLITYNDASHLSACPRGRISLREEF